jgi:hypothetical protein
MRCRDAAVALALLLLAGCSATSRFERSRVPPALAVAAGVAAPAIDFTHRTPITPERVRLTREYLALHNPPLAAQLPPADVAESIAFVPRLVVVHYTAIPTLAETVATFTPLEIDPERSLVASHGRLNVGIHYVVDRDGTIYSLYPETVISRHVIGLNHVAIGIENVGAADLGGPAEQAPLTPAQLAANVALVRDLVRRHPTIEFVIGHHEYRDVEHPDHPAQPLFFEAFPGYRSEKVDPGPRFMRRLRRALRAPTG